MEIVSTSPRTEEDGLRDLAAVHELRRFAQERPAVAALGAEAVTGRLDVNPPVEAIDLPVVPPAEQARVLTNH